MTPTTKGDAVKGGSMELYEKQIKERPVSGGLTATSASIQTETPVDSSFIESIPEELIAQVGAYDYDHAGGCG